ncbi:MAG: hypothetical protein JW820_06275 [Spirochaetales bacterium]|nr:hypothetical protein [Spirochaetales bacterium]
MDPNRPAGPLHIDEGREVSESERQEILSQIERAIQGERKPLAEELDHLQARRKGRLFPILVNVVAAVLVAAGAFLFSELFEIRSESITLRSAGLVSAEGTLLETLRRESQGQIRDKELQIAAIEKRLATMDEQTVALKARFESDLRAREEELRRRVEAEMVEERDRLVAAGTTASAIDRRIREMEAEREAALRNELERYRSDLQAALRQKEQELVESRRQLQGTLAAATSERVRLASEMTQREAELRNRFQRERESLEQEASAAEQRLAALQETYRQQQVLEDQLSGHYRDALDRLAVGDLAGAGEALERLNRLLDSPGLARVPGLLERRTLDRALSKALEELIALRSAPASPGPPGPPARADGAEQLAALQLRVARLEADLAAAVRENARLERWRAEVDALHDRYAEVRERVLRLTTQGGESSLREAEQLLLAVLRDPAATAILPGIVGQLEQARGPGAAPGLNAAEQTGREAALVEVLRYLTYLSRGTGGRELESELMAQARTDPLYGAVIREIQVLLAGGGPSGEVVSPYRLLGTVASVSGSRVTVEPLGDVPAAPGATVQIRRSDGLEQEILIAQGTVEQLRGGRIYARVDTVAAAGRGPQKCDLVYIAPSAAEGRAGE